jgi:ABC-2 type transport system ATP-binding protein
MLSANEVSVFFKKAFLKPEIKALDNFNLQVNAGDIFGLLGPNGAGKSTAMYCFLGLIKPDKGNVTLSGRNPDPGEAMYEKIAYIPEEPHYPLYLTVEEAITFYASLYRAVIPKTKILEVMDRVGLVEARDLKLEKCSKGMKQKAGIAISLLNDPELVFLDEPTRGLDPFIVKEFRDIILEMNKRGTTFVINSHILSEVEAVCNRVAIMNKGKVVVQDELTHLLQHDLNHYSIEIDYSAAMPPEYFVVSSQTEQRLKGEIPTEKFQAFLEWIRENKLILYECSLKKISLEEAFFNVYRESPLV